jgi:hypothetical protein
MVPSAGRGEDAMLAGEKHGPEPWSQDIEDPRVIHDGKREIAALGTSVENARRIIASVNAVRRVSTDSLDAGIVSEGLRCLSLLCRYHSDETYRNEIDGKKEFDKILASGTAVWKIIQKETLSRDWF